MFSRLRKLEKHSYRYLARERAAPRLFKRLFLATLFFRRGAAVYRAPVAPCAAVPAAAVVFARLAPVVACVLIPEAAALCGLAPVPSAFARGSVYLVCDALAPVCVAALGPAAVSEPVVVHCAAVPAISDAPPLLAAVGAAPVPSAAAPVSLAVDGLAPVAACVLALGPAAPFPFDSVLAAAVAGGAVPVAPAFASVPAAWGGLWGARGGVARPAPFSAA